jgi:hypothetical protein
MAADEPIGRLTLAAIHDGEASRASLERTLSLIEEIEDELPTFWGPLTQVAVAAPQTTLAPSEQEFVVVSDLPQQYPK